MYVHVFTCFNMITIMGKVAVIVRVQRNAHFVLSGNKKRCWKMHP